MQSRVECRAESNAEQRARRPQQREEQNRDETRAEPGTRGRAEPEEQRRETRAEQRCRGAKAQICRGAKAQNRKPAEFRVKAERRNTGRKAGEKRSYIGRARARGARGDRSHAHQQRRTSSVRLTQLVGVSQARGCIRRANAQHRLRGAKQERSTYRVRHVTKAAYILIHCTIYLYKCTLYSRVTIYQIERGQVFINSLLRRRMKLFCKPVN